MSSILALAAKFLALSVKFFRIICSVGEQNTIGEWNDTTRYVMGELTLLSVIGGRTMVFSMVCMTIFHNSLSRRLSTAFSQDSA
jgi:hypothetical protein